MSSLNIIRFYLNGQLHEVANVESTTTLLNYLRETLLQTGSKEGCAEGDCGACTVVIAEQQDGRLRFRSINSCIQFLPTLDGKALYTVEGLRNKDGSLHPAQQAMVDCHASQCGFCTPGFVMSLFALYKSENRPDRQLIDDALAGNLCRCTGYRPIIDAAGQMYEYGKEQTAEQQTVINSPGSVKALEKELVEQLEMIKPAKDKKLGRHFYAPLSLDSLTSCYAEHPEATLLAGGTDVGLWVTKQYRDLPEIIYLGQIEELKRINIAEGFIQIGASVSLTDAFECLLEHYPDLDEIARRFASPPIRNAGTLCGNVANGSPIGDSMPALLCLGTIVRLRSAAGSRDVPMHKFYLGYQQKDLQQAEFVEAVLIPLPEEQHVFRSYKISKRFDQDISAVCAAFNLVLKDGVVDEISIAYGGMAAIPQRALQCEKSLLGQNFELAIVEKSMQVLSEDFTPLTDMRASADYRIKVAANLLLRFYHEVNGAAKNTTHVLRYVG
ncbi:MAG: xanthine dehydrogenase small subunit [Gammaproteobacteria bacterium]|nr:xanthine dehydrogenase small subunit [Gammaproteobacteria bacterium]